MEKGFFALVLHAHLPFVRHPEHAEFMEEDWLFEAIGETYIPLVAMLDRLTRDGVPFQFTIGLTPPLCEMLADPLLEERYDRRLRKLVDLAGKEIRRTRGHDDFNRMAHFYHARFTEELRIFSCNASSSLANLLPACSVTTDFESGYLPSTKSRTALRRC